MPPTDIIDSNTHTHTHTHILSLSLSLSLPLSLSNSCFKCQTCQKPQTAGSYISEGNRVWCKAHYAQRNTVIERMIRT